MRLDEYMEYDALGLKELLDRGEVSGTELHDIASGAIEALNPTLNFMVSFSPEEAERALTHLDPKAPFAGIPFLIKGGAGMAGQPASPGCRLGEGLLCEQDSELVRRLKRTGIVTLGSTSTPEICNSFTTEPVFSGPTRNPWNVEHSVGGSSGGSSAAVAAGVVPMAQSGDGAGSIRVPAHCCGVFGLAPSRGRNPVGPDWHGGLFGILRQHVTSRSVRDSAAMLDQLFGDESGALHRVAPPNRPFLDEVNADPGSLRIAFSTQGPSGQSVHQDCKAAVTQAALLCNEMGHRVEEAAPAYDGEHFLKAFYDYWAYEYSAGMRALEKASGKAINPDTLESNNLLMWDHYKSLTVERISELMMEIYTFNRNIDQFFDHWDILITPVCLTPAPPLGKIGGKPDKISGEYSFDRMLLEFAPFTAMANVGGQPSMSVPLYQSSEGLPVGVLCTARVGDEATLIRLAAQFEQACPWINRRPPVNVYPNIIRKAL